MSNYVIKAELRTNAVLMTKSGKQINLGHIDRRILGIRWTPRLWFYKYITYPLRKDT